MSSSYQESDDDHMDIDDDEEYGDVTFEEDVKPDVDHHLTTKTLYSKFSGILYGKSMTIEQMCQKFYNEDNYNDILKPKIDMHEHGSDLRDCLRVNQGSTRWKMNSRMINSVNDDGSENPNMKQFQDNLRIRHLDMITSLDIEKSRYLLDEVKINGPKWIIGLVTNMAGQYDKNGEKLKTPIRVKCLTILFLTNLSLGEIEERFNTESKVPCSTLKQYCGRLPVLVAIDGFTSLETAKLAFICWKNRTRGKFSRFVCAEVIYNYFKSKYNEECGDLKKYVLNINPKEKVKKLMKYTKK